MAIKYAIEKHCTGFPSKVLAEEGGAHILNIKITTEDGIDNGWFVGKGDWLGLDLYEEDAPTSFSGVIREQAANGNWYVEVISATNAYFVYTVPMIEEEYNNNFKAEANFYNAAGDVARCYELKPLDIVEVSAGCFTSTPSVNDTVGLSGNKLALTGSF